MISSLLLVLLPLFVQGKTIFDYRKCGFALEKLSEIEWEFYEKINGIYRHFELDPVYRIKRISTCVKAAHPEWRSPKIKKMASAIFIGYVITDVERDISSRNDELSIYFESQSVEELKQMIWEFDELTADLTELGENAKKLFIQSMRVVLSRKLEDEKEEIKKEILPIVDCFKRVLISNRLRESKSLEELKLPPDGQD